MADTNDVPSTEARRLIRKARNRGLRTEQGVIDFTAMARRAILAFDAEVEPLHLSDEDYEAVARASGLHHLLVTAVTMVTHLSALSEDRAA